MYPFLFTSLFDEARQQYTDKQTDIVYINLFVCFIKKKRYEYALYIYNTS